MHYQANQIHRCSYLPSASQHYINFCTRVSISLPTGFEIIGFYITSPFWHSFTIQHIQINGRKLLFLHHFPSFLPELLPRKAVEWLWPSLPSAQHQLHGAMEIQILGVWGTHEIISGDGIGTNTWYLVVSARTSELYSNLTWYFQVSVCLFFYVERTCGICFGIFRQLLRTVMNDTRECTNF